MPLSGSAIAAVQAAQVLESADLEIATAADRDRAVELMRSVREREAQWKQLREDAVKPLRDLATEKRKEWAPALSMFEQARTMLQQRIAAFELTARQQAQAALASAAPTEVARAAELMTPRPKGLQLRTTYAAAVIDPAAVPRKFLMPDLAKLNAHARRTKDDFAVPGCQLLKTTKAV